MLKWYGDDVKKQIADAMPDGFWTAAEQLLSVAESKAPQGATGDLRSSGYITSKDRSTYRNAKNHNKEASVKEAGAVAVGFAAFYARFHELGTRNMAARPFLRPAVDEMKDKLPGVVVTKMRSKLR